MKNPPKRHESEMQSHGQLFDFGRIEKKKNVNYRRPKVLGRVQIYTGWPFGYLILEYPFGHN